MATKKQKRQRLIAKREAEMEEYRRSGLAALQKERERRFQKELQDWEKQHGEKHSWKKRIIECPHCRLEMKVARDAESVNAQHQAEPASA